MTLEQFSDIIDRDLKITRYSNQKGRFCVRFEQGSVKEGSFLAYYSGNGDSYDSAARDYASKLKGQKLIIEGVTRLEFNVPEDLV